MNKLKVYLKNYPVGVVGTGVALTVLSECLEYKMIDYWNMIAIIYTIITLIIMFAKIIIYPKVVIEEIKNPVVGSFYPIIDMAIMILAQDLLPLNQNAARIIWTIAVIVHFIYIIGFLIFQLKDFNFKKIYPSWYVVLAGAAVATETSIGMRDRTLAMATLYISLILFLIFYPFMLYKIKDKEFLNGSLVQTSALLASPASLTLVSYLIIMEKPNNILIGFLAFLSIVNTAIVYSILIKVFKSEFKPLNAAFTFPLTISTLAMYKLSDYLISINNPLHGFFSFLGDIRLFVAVYVVLFVIYNFIKIFYKTMTITE